MIDKSIRQYYADGQLVKPGKGRPGYQGEKMYWDEKEIPMPKNLDANITQIQNWMKKNPDAVEQKHINYAHSLNVAKHNKMVKEDPQKRGTRVKQSWESEVPFRTLNIGDVEPKTYPLNKAYGGRIDKPLMGRSRDI